MQTTKRIPPEREVTVNPGPNFLAGIVFGKTALEFTSHREIYKQGEPANSVYYLREGVVKLVAKSEHGKDVIVALVHEGEFFGEGCLSGKAGRSESAVALTDCKVEKIEKSVMARLLHEQRKIQDVFLRFLLTRNIRYEEALVDQVCSDSERRLARVLLRLGEVSPLDPGDLIVTGVNQEDLAQMIGTTRPRVSHFMSEFRRHGLVDYDPGGRMTIHRERLRTAISSQSRKKEEQPPPSVH